MRTSDVEILIVPGWSGSGPDHWQSRWERSLKTARRVEQEDWLKPQSEQWSARIAGAVAASEKPVVLVAHSLGVISVAHAAPRLDLTKVAGAYLVAPADIENAKDWPVTEGHSFEQDVRDFGTMPREPLPFPSTLIASHTDPYCCFERAKEIAAMWGSKLLEAGDAGHVNVASGHGPWPEGLLQFGLFLKDLQEPAAGTK
ncbi:alpha/beta hydrolase [Filomicrobium sp.]|uniref:RBBP9/YdeN family alpha/beta hydrolase n=1 Tax=Filomicrobium sp. TaxID=2024831 RepID=UPI002584C9EA|nr:alpha/beta hydrolase [Filomicrobium sp.]MCV0369317.1 alpha/beta hydrolase [Filomicrobium sp.]